jgi:hypothetical protein
MATLACVFGLAQSANAGVTVDVVFQDATMPTGITILPGDAASPGCDFGGYYNGSAPSGRCMDVIMMTSWDWIGAGFSVAYDSDNGLAVTQVNEWANFVAYVNPKSGAMTFCNSAGGIADNGAGLVGQFDCIIAPPNAPPQASPGTFKLGTIIWDTSATTGPSTETVAAVIAGGDGFIAVINGNILDVSAQVVVHGQVLNIIPEPGTASLLGLGFAGLIVAGRRSRA